MVAESRASNPKAARDAAETVKQAAKRIRDTSKAVRETVKTFRESGAVQEMAEAAKEAAFAARDSTRDIRDTVVEVKNSNVVSDTAAAIDQTAGHALQTARAGENVARQFPKGAPKTTRATKRAAVGASRSIKRHVPTVRKKTAEVSRQVSTSGKSAAGIMVRKASRSVRVTRRKIARQGRIAA